MAKLTERELAEIIREMPEASDAEIVAEAKRREAAKEPGLFERLTTPLTTLPSRVAGALGDLIDQRSLDESKLGAQLKGFAAGALQGAGDLVSQMTSPLDLALTLVSGGGAVAARRGATGLASAARSAERALMTPMIAQGAVEAARGAAEGDLAKVGSGALMAGAGGAGLKLAGAHAAPSAPAPSVSRAVAATPPAPGPTAGALPDAPPVQMMAGNPPPEFHAVLSGFSDPSRFADPKNGCSPI